MSAIHWLNDKARVTLGEEAVKTQPVDPEVADFFKPRWVDVMGVENDDTEQTGK